MSKVDARLAAITVLQAVLDEGLSLTNALLKLPKGDLDAAQQSLAKALCFGVMRWYGYLNTVLTELLQTPLRKRDSDLRILLLIGLYQLKEQRVPNYASVSEAVNSVKGLQKPWAKGLVNAVLRNYIRRRDQLMQTDWSIQYAYPAWLSEQIKRDWPQQHVSLLQAGNQQAPLTLRVNQRRISVADYRALLLELGVEANCIAEIPGALQLSVPRDIERLPGYQEGLFSVQDAAAQLAAILLDPKPGELVLDACAAPGGKTSHILERQAEIKRLVAVDIDAQRCQRIQDNLQRLHPDWSETTQIRCADVLDFDQWWNGELFDCILLDAPCSATGVIRRHPDIKFFRQQKDIEALCEAQRHMLNGLWSLLKPGGRLLYVTCSILKCENEDQIDAFIRRSDQNHNGGGNAVQLLKMSVPYAQTRPAGVQLFPGENDMDGFYYAALGKF